MTNIQPQVQTTAQVSPFDAIKQTHDGVEFWSARQLMPFLGYGRWNEFREAIYRAQLACANSGHDASQHFSVTTLKTSGRPAEDIELTRFACYLTGMAGDPRKAEIACAQTYFAVQTRVAEVQQARTLTGASPLALSRAMLEALEQQDVRVTEIERRLDLAPIIGAQLGTIYRLGQQLGTAMGDYGQAWRLLKGRFGLASYRDLPTCQYEEAVQFLQLQIASYARQRVLL